MIPLQDVVPSGRVPLATLALIGLNVISFAATSAGAPALQPFAHAGLVPMLIAIHFLWLFGDNVEARLGRVLLVAIYVVGGLLPGVGAAGAVTALLGSYFVILPNSRVLMLAPTPDILEEVPAVLLLTVWAVLQLLRSVGAPRSMWMMVAAFVLGAVVARVMRPAARW